MFSFLPAWRRLFHRIQLPQNKFVAYVILEIIELKRKVYLTGKKNNIYVQEQICQSGRENSYQNESSPRQKKTI